MVLVSAFWKEERVKEKSVCFDSETTQPSVLKASGYATYRTSTLNPTTQGRKEKVHRRTIEV
ncbi:hypothetical protein TorRG33x02_197230 [Trema orientale]|uniref:Uncharacterized protein n=1 Tax=Trema orientale TaxID=63057 RepID=A0A2P5EG59_TREOI|nr:hypothetical protein TorRG33x02_197230 [Trema orientale]